MILSFWLNFDNFQNQLVNRSHFRCREAFSKDVGVTSEGILLVEGVKVTTSICLERKFLMIHSRQNNILYFDTQSSPILPPSLYPCMCLSGREGVAEPIKIIYCFIYLQNQELQPFGSLPDNTPFISSGSFWHQNCFEISWNSILFHFLVEISHCINNLRLRQSSSDWSQARPAHRQTACHNHSANNYIIRQTSVNIPSFKSGSNVSS